MLGMNDISILKSNGEKILVEIILARVTGGYHYQNKPKSDRHWFGSRLYNQDQPPKQLFKEIHDLFVLEFYRFNLFKTCLKTAKINQLFYRN